MARKPHPSQRRDGVGVTMTLYHLNARPKHAPTNENSRRPDTEHEAQGSESASYLLDELLACDTQAEAVPAIRLFLERLGKIPDAECRRGFAAGASTSLADVLMLGLAAVRARSKAERGGNQ